MTSEPEIFEPVPPKPAGSTTYHRETVASAGDVKTGSTVAVRVDLRSLRNGGTTPAASDVTILP